MESLLARLAFAPARSVGNPFSELIRCFPSRRRLTVNTIGELFNIGELLGKQLRPLGPRFVDRTKSGGPAATSTPQSKLPIAV
jgi:hypothetical protein